ncbi:hypothetical protein MMC25_002707 [Agyrium rufum]|nr:hypothetical protein [Agyrium rufum]
MDEITKILVASGTADDKEDAAPSNAKSAEDVADMPEPPSLQDLAVTKGLEEILDPSFPDSEFASLEPRLQQLLFRKLRTEMHRLYQIEDSWSVMKQWCSLADSFLYTRAARKRIPEPDCYEGQEGEDVRVDSQNGHNLISEFPKAWSYASESDADDRSFDRSDDHVHWGAFDLMYKLPDSDLRVVSRAEQTQAGYTFHDENGLFYNRISSQLLQYRVTVVFGMIPQDESDGYKCQWLAELIYKDGKSRLRLDEHKGSANVHFTGTAEASTEAVRFLNFLTGNNIPHTYDGILAGTVA